MLTLNNIEVVYDGVILVLKGVSLGAEEGRITDPARRQRRRQDDDAEGDLRAAAQPNAARSPRARSSSMASGSTSCAPHDVVRRGVAQVFEGRRVFENLTVEENLVAGGHTLPRLHRDPPGIERRLRTFSRC